MPASAGSLKKQQISRKTSPSALLTMPGPLTGHGTTDWFQIGKGVCQGCILLPCLFNLYAEYIMRSIGKMNHKVASRLLGEISINHICKWNHP